MFCHWTAHPAERPPFLAWLNLRSNIPSLCPSVPALIPSVRGLYKVTGSHLWGWPCKLNEKFQMLTGIYIRIFFLSKNSFSYFSHVSQLLSQFSCHWNYPRFMYIANMFVKTASTCQSLLFSPLLSQPEKKKLLSKKITLVSMSHPSPPFPLCLRDPWKLVKVAICSWEPFSWSQIILCISSNHLPFIS